MKTAIITGFSGQDGAYLSQLLLNNNYKVIGLTRSHNKNSLTRLSYLCIDKEVIVEECDLTDFSQVIRIFGKYQPDEVYNLAAHLLYPNTYSY